MSTQTREDVYAELADLIEHYQFGRARDLMQQLLEDDR